MSSDKMSTIMFGIDIPAVKMHLMQVLNEHNDELKQLVDTSVDAFMQHKAPALIKEKIDSAIAAAITQAIETSAYGLKRAIQPKIDELLANEISKLNSNEPA